MKYIVVLVSQKTATLFSYSSICDLLNSFAMSRNNQNARVIKNILIHAFIAKAIMRGKKDDDIFHHPTYITEMFIHNQFKFKGNEIK